MKERSIEKEYIDLGLDFYTLEEYEDCLYQLARVGKILGGDRASLNAFYSLGYTPESILDVGCGGGNFTNKLAQAFPICTVHGIDFSKEAIDYAKKQIESLASNNISFSATEKLELTYPEKSVDVVTCTLVCHHMSDNQIVDFLKRARKTAKKSIVINDLHRSWVAYLSYAMIAPLIFRNRLNIHDGLISIKRGFLKSDWDRILEQAGFLPNQYQIKWRWAFRWIVVINL